MSEVRREPRVPPIETPLLEADGKTMTRAWWRYFQGERGYTDNVNSGAAQARADAQAAISAAVQAQGTANGAVAGVATLASQTLTLSATVSPTSAYGDDFAPVVITTASVTVTPVGGTGPFVYAWTITGADIAITSPAAATTTFSSVGLVAVGEFRSQVATCLVTDSLAATYLIDVGVSMYGDFTL